MPAQKKCRRRCRTSRHLDEGTTRCFVGHWKIHFAQPNGTLDEGPEFFGRIDGVDRSQPSKGHAPVDRPGLFVADCGGVRLIGKPGFWKRQLRHIRTIDLGQPTGDPAAVPKGGEGVGSGKSGNDHDQLLSLAEGNADGSQSLRNFKARSPEETPRPPGI